MVDVKHPIQVSSEKMRVARVNKHLVLLAGENKASVRLDEKSLRKIHHYLEHAKPEKSKKADKKCRAIKLNCGECLTEDW